MRTIERLFRRIALIGTPWAINDPTPPGFTGWRSRVLGISIGFGWMAKGGPYDDRTFYQRTIGNTSARWHFRNAVSIR